MDAMIDRGPDDPTGPRGDRFRLHPDVAFVARDGEARLLDLNRGLFYGLDEVGATLIATTLEAGPEAAAARVAGAYDAPIGTVRADLDALLRTLVRRGVLVEARDGRRPDIPSRRALTLGLGLAWLSIRLLGWSRSVRLWRLTHRPPRGESVTEREAGLVRELDRAVRDAGGRMLLTVDCKERALLGWHLLRRRFGLPARLLVGVEFYPFGAHAWVECGGLSVTDDAWRCRLYARAVEYA